jgi:YHS domain-containing protein
MKRRIFTVTCLIAVLSTAVFVIGTGAQDETVKKKVTGCCPGCPMGRTAEAGEADATAGHQTIMQCCMSMMQKAGVKPEMIRRCQTMMRTPIFIDSPCAVYGQAGILKLSEEQKKKLIEIENEARKKAFAVLTEEQKKQMGDIPEKPMAMAQMCQQMCSKMMPMMQKMMSSEGKTGPMMMCPMMHMIGGEGPKGSMTCPWMQTPSGGSDVQAETKQVTCPVMGGQINKDVYVEHKGKKVYFCCPGCKGEFKSDPEKYMDKLPQYKQ